jgi:hypothetical protein
MHASRSGRFNSGESATGIQVIRSWSGRRTCPEGERAEKCYPYRDSNSVPSVVASHCSDCAVAA